MKRIGAAIALIAGLSASADEGLWPYNQFPSDSIKQKHGF